MNTSDRKLFNSIVNWLDVHGFRVIPKNEASQLISFGDFAERTGKSRQVLGAKLRHPNCPEFISYPINGKRIRFLVPHERLYKFVKQYGYDKVN
jgi:hypothetical protein